ncbi:DUF397 domain-containing protein [Streptomyces sp. NPDC051956]|uniref:DUF397 domain-containing protein n=1 Tax=Streptomyces sp. NPDC051956 TaxID=3365677 RepID=UPI0037CDCCB7
MAQEIVWQKSSYSGGQDGPDCLELATHEGAALLRESDAPCDVLRVRPEALAGLIRRVRQVGPVA